jgi:hypothetical protein
MNAALIVTMGLVGVGSAVCEKVLVAMGKADTAEWIRVGGISLVGVTAVGLAVNLLKTVKGMF